MDFSHSFGGLIPVWIIAAPLLAALFSLLSTPEPTRRREPLMPQPVYPSAAAGLGVDRP